MHGIDLAGEIPRTEDVMSSLQLNQSQVGILKKYLGRAISEITSEIAHTDSLDYRDALKAERQLLHEVLEQVDAPTET